MVGIYILDCELYCTVW